MMPRDNEGHQETLESIKDAIYDLEIGPTEISLFRGDFPAYSVTFEITNGDVKDVIIPIPSAYPSIFATLNANLRPTRPKPV
jgi:hypothetical protein